MGFLQICLLASVPFIGYTQKYTEFSANFSILEKNTLRDSSSLVHGTVTYNLQRNETIYNLTFPEQKIWSFKDSILTVSGIDTVYSQKEFSNLNQLTIFQNILTQKLNDYGLKDAGYMMSEVNEIGDKVVVQWNPPNLASKFLNRVITEVENQNLTAVAFVDIDEKPINRTYFDKYIKHKDISIPTEIKSYFKADKEEIFRILIFSNVEIQ